MGFTESKELQETMGRKGIPGRGSEPRLGREPGDCSPRPGWLDSSSPGQHAINLKMRARLKMDIQQAGWETGQMQWEVIKRLQPGVLFNGF